MSKTDSKPPSDDRPGIDQVDPTAELDQLKAKLEDLEQKNLRLIADGRNIAQRSTREKQEAIKYAEFDFAKELLTIIDDLDRTTETGRTATDPAPILDGVRITHEHFLKLLKSRGILPIEAAGRPFDPQFHEAILQQPSENVAPGAVMQDVQRGYTMHDRVLRPARVIVSSGPAGGGAAE